MGSRMLQSHFRSSEEEHAYSSHLLLEKSAARGQEKLHSMRKPALASLLAVERHLTVYECTFEWKSPGGVDWHFFVRHA